MTLSEIAERVARRVGAPPDLAWGFLREASKIIVEVLDQGGEVKIRGLGTLRWVPVVGQKVYDLPTGKTILVEPGSKLKLIPALKLRTRRVFNVGRRNDETGSST